ncbi:MAG: type II toxin-antitoxin system PemK/MazF family toxin [Opitutales bacterium]
METFDRFDLILVPFPFTDRTLSKRRPAVILSAGSFFTDTGQVICAMVTTAKQSDWSSDVTLKDWQSAGLPVPSRVRLKIFTLDHRLILRHLGRLSRRDQRSVQAALKGLFGTA